MRGMAPPRLQLPQLASSVARQTLAGSLNAAARALAPRDQPLRSATAAAATVLSEYYLKFQVCQASPGPARRRDSAGAVRDRPTLSPGVSLLRAGRPADTVSQGRLRYGH